MSKKSIAIDAMKQRAARAAIERIVEQKREKLILGVGTGSTVNLFIEYLPTIEDRITACVASSEDTAVRLRVHKFDVIELNDTTKVDLYVDGADEINHYGEMIKGGGGALTREKIIAAAADEFWCIVDKTKVVKRLGDFPLPVEVIPMARSHIARVIVGMNASPVYRSGFTTDNHNQILDVHNLDIGIPADMEAFLTQMPGLVTCGIFSGNTAADIALVGTCENDITIITSQ